MLLLEKVGWQSIEGIHPKRGCNNDPLGVGSTGSPQTKETKKEYEGSPPSSNQEEKGESNLPSPLVLYAMIPHQIDVVDWHPGNPKPPHAVIAPSQQPLREEFSSVRLVSMTNDTEDHQSKS